MFIRQRVVLALDDVRVLQALQPQLRPAGGNGWKPWVRDTGQQDQQLRAAITTPFHALAKERQQLPNLHRGWLPQTQV